LAKEALSQSPATRAWETHKPFEQAGTDVDNANTSDKPILGITAHWAIICRPRRMLGLMKRDLVMAGKAVGGAGLTGAVLYLVATAPTHVHVYWPYWLFLAVVLVGIGLYFTGQERSPAVAIVSPEADHDVPQAMTARGSATRIPDNMTLWLIVQAGRNFYPQTKIHLSPDGRWFELVHFGRIDGSVGREYALRVVGADPEASSRFEIYKQQSARQDTAPLSEDKGTYPKVTTYAAVKVIRGALTSLPLLAGQACRDLPSQK
jgi:hypothetical protein